MNSLLSKIFSKLFTYILLFIVLIGILIYLRFPKTFYDLGVNSISDLLKDKYGTGGSKIKIDIGLNKLGKMIILLSLFAILYFQFWKWLIGRTKGITQVVSTSLNGIIDIKKKDWYIIFLFLSIGILLRMLRLNQSMWQDEIGVYKMFMKNGIITTVFPLNSMGSHPLMQIIVKLFTNLFGVSEFTLHFPIFIFSIVSIALIYVVCLKLTQQRSVAIIAAAFLTFHSYHIYYSFQMRGYVMLIFFCILSTYLLLKSFTVQNKIINL